jgi:hypothetical protein
LNFDNIDFEKIYKYYIEIRNELVIYCENDEENDDSQTKLKTFCEEIRNKAIRCLCESKNFKNELFLKKEKMVEIETEKEKNNFKFDLNEYPTELSNKIAECVFPFNPGF